MSDPWDHPITHRWADHVRDEVIPALRNSRCTVSLLPVDPDLADIKLAAELGLTLLLGKPLILAVRPGTQVPDALVAAATEIVEVDDVASPATADAIRAAVLRLAGTR